MRYFNNGIDSFTVTVTAREVEAFGARWPCSRLRSRPVTFSFDARHGLSDHADLVDHNAARQQPDADDAAILALSEDAMRYGLAIHFDEEGPQ